MGITERIVRAIRKPLDQSGLVLAAALVPEMRTSLALPATLQHVSRARDAPWRAMVQKSSRGWQSSHATGPSGPSP